MQYRFNFVLLLTAVVLVFGGCARPGPEFSTFVKPEVDFSAFQSFQWQETRPETLIMQARRELMHRLIVQTIDQELEADGLEKRESADLVVTYRLTVSPQKGFWQTLTAAESITPGAYNQRSAEAQTSSVEERKLKQGVLVIELRDRNDLVVWSGRASAIVSEAMPGRAVEAVRRIMEKYPPYE
ncbi:MAG: hypothetical protein C0623_08560 [Desulfuromonas sp.]|nr:MAG: hypothetical protein C0623_08560 [Desulfuromonas sp.]